MPERPRGSADDSASSLRARVAELEAQLLRASEDTQRYRALIEAFPVGVVVHSGGLIRFVNRAAARAFAAARPEDLVGTPVIERVHPDCRELVARRIEAVYGRAPASLVEERFLRLDGTPFDAETSGAVTTWEGAPASLAVFADITARKQAEADRTRLEEELRQSQKMESLGRLAGGVAHDFNNLLTGILGYVDLALRRAELAPPLRADLDEARRATLAAAELTQQLLAFSRRQPIASRLVDPVAALRRARNLLARLVGEDVRLAVEAEAEDLGRIRVDPGQLDQVLVNLAVNARDAMPQGGSLTLSARRVPAASGERIAIEVEDSGCGMDSETRRRMFEPFFSTKPEGTGLGLATVYGIVQQNGGEIEVLSAPGQGTRVRLTFPRHEEAAAVEPAARPQPPGSGETILVVEDEAQVRRLVVYLLQESGYRVLAADGAAEARARLAALEGPLHLLLTDVVLPGTDGRRLYEELAGGRPELRVLFMSGYTRDILASRGVPDEAHDFIRKPFRVDDLLAKVRDSLAGPPPRRPADRPPG